MSLAGWKPEDEWQSGIYSSPGSIRGIGMDYGRLRGFFGRGLSGETLVGRVDKARLGGIVVCFMPGIYLIGLKFPRIVGWFLSLRLQGGQQKERDASTREICQF